MSPRVSDRLWTVRTTRVSTREQVQEVRVHGSPGVCIVTYQSRWACMATQPPLPDIFLYPMARARARAAPHRRWPTGAASRRETDQGGAGERQFFDEDGEMEEIKTARRVRRDTNGRGGRVEGDVSQSQHLGILCA
jgi:hypothetical protein